MALKSPEIAAAAGIENWGEVVKLITKSVFKLEEQALKGKIDISQ